jgi:hypothetical protein
MSTKPDDPQAAVTGNQETPTNGQGTPTSPDPASHSLDSQTAEQNGTAASAPTRLQFSREEYSGQSSAVVEVTRTGSKTGEARVIVTAKESSASNGRNSIPPKELVFQDGEEVQTHTVPLSPNLSSDNTMVSVELSAPQNAELGEPSKARIVVQPGNLLNYFRDVAVKSATSHNTRRVVKHILLTLVLIGGIYGLDKVVKSYADHHKQEWLGYLTPTQRPGLTFPVVAPDKTDFVITDYEKERLSHQLERIKDKELYHLKLMEYYYTGYYMGIILLSFTTPLAAITLVLISKKGWAATSEYIITTFFIMTCASLFFGSWAGLFKQEENITENKALFLKYASLENELRSYAATGEALNYRVSRADLNLLPDTPPQHQASPQPSPAKASKAKEGSPAEQPQEQEAQSEMDINLGIKLIPADFIHYIDLQLAQDNIAIGFDYSQVPNYNNAFSNLTK